MTTWQRAVYTPVFHSKIPMLTWGGVGAETPARPAGCANVTSICCRCAEKHSGFLWCSSLQYQHYCTLGGALCSSPLLLLPWALGNTKCLLRKERIKQTQNTSEHRAPPKGNVAPEGLSQVFTSSAIFLSSTTWNKSPLLFWLPVLND